MVIRVRDHVSQCYSNSDGDTIRELIAPHLIGRQRVVVSFDGFTTATSSFVNSAFIDLLNSMSFDEIKAHLSFDRTSRQIADLIRKRFEFEVTHRIED